jgi:hypothetical protein
VTCGSALSTCLKLGKVTVLSTHAVGSRQVPTLRSQSAAATYNYRLEMEHTISGAYVTVVPSIVIISRSTRPDLCYSAGMLAMFLDSCDTHRSSAASFAPTAKKQAILTGRC